MQNKGRISFMNIGSSSLLVIFLALCLATFSVLALSSAKSDYTFSKKAAEHREAYYAAANTAEHMLAELDHNIKVARKASEADTFDNSFTRALATTLGNEYTYDTVQQLLYFSVPISEREALTVTVRLEAPTSHRRYTVTRWEVTATSDWTADDTMELYQP